MGNNTTESPVNRSMLIFVMAPNGVIGLIGMCGSVITVRAIVTCKKLHSPCFILIAGSAFGSFVNAAHFLTAAIEKIGGALGIIPMRRPGALCLVITGVLAFWGITFHALLTACVSLDRLFGILVPNRYRLWGKWYAIGVLFSCFIFVTGQVIVGFVTSELTKLIVCTPYATLHPLYKLFIVRFNLFLVTVTVLAYGAMWAVLRIRHKKHKAQQDKFMKQQLAVVPTIKAMALLYLATGVLSEILANIVVALPVGTAAFVVMTVAQYLKNASSLVEVSALIMRNQAFRESCKQLIRWKATSPVVRL